MIFLKIRYLILLVLIFILSGCSTKMGYDYSIHKPKVRFKPSLSALDRLDHEALGRKYVWAEEGPYCYDCSGLTYYNYGSMGIEIPRVADAQFRSGTPVSRDQLQKGDLVFFGNGYRATHVGIYIGNGMFEHASSAKGRVTISSLNKPYYRRHYMGARRYYNFNPQPQFTPSLNMQRVNFDTSARTLEENAYSNRNISKSGSLRTNYYLQLGTYSYYPGNEVEKLQLSGLNALAKEQNGKYRLLVGPYPTIVKAKKSINNNPTLLVNAKIVRILKG